jgi:N-acetylglutamate synthase-like GNAT family acetyltransferase
LNANEFVSSDINNHIPVRAADMRDEQSIVIAHAYIQTVAQTQHGTCAILTNVIISPSYRRQNYGKLLMRLCEQLIRSCMCAYVYLSTFDQQLFYIACGYEQCEAVSNLAANTKRLNQKQVTTISTTITHVHTHTHIHTNHQNNKQRNFYIQCAPYCLFFLLFV